MMRSQLLTTKLTLPPSRETLVARQRLLQALEEAINTSNLILVAAPAGFGKTTMLADWLKQTHHRVAWVSLDERDNDEVRFFSYMIEAVRSADAEIAQGIQELLQSPKTIPLPTILDMLLNDLHQSKHDVIMVFDDYHLIENQSIHESLQYFIEHLPPNIVMTLSTRIDPPFPLARWRVRN